MPAASYLGESLFAIEILLHDEFDLVKYHSDPVSVLLVLVDVVTIERMYCLVWC